MVFSVKVPKGQYLGLSYGTGMANGTQLVQFQGGGTTGDIRDLNAKGVGVTPTDNQSNSYTPTTGVLANNVYTFVASTPIKTGNGQG